jgi:hypothetical protein
MNDHDETPARESYDWAFIAACTLTLAVVLVTYANSLHNAFQFDDVHVIQNNLFIRSIGNIPHFFRDAATFSSLPLNATYRPVLTTSLALDYWLGGGLQPWQFHTTQLVLLALLGVMLVFLFVRVFDTAEAHPWNRYAAVFTALLFTVHTANSETANYISARSEILSAMGVVGALLLYIYRPQSRRYYLYLIPMVLGALAKASADVRAALVRVHPVLREAGLGARRVRAAVAAHHRGGLPRESARVRPGARPVHLRRVHECAGRHVRGWRPRELPGHAVIYMAALHEALFPAGRPHGGHRLGTDFQVV